MPTKSTKKTEVKKKEPKFKLDMSVNGETFSFKGDDVKEMFNTWEKPGLFKTKFVAKLSSGKKTVEDVLNTHEVRRMINNSTKLELFVTNLVKRLG